MYRGISGRLNLTVGEVIEKLEKAYDVREEEEDKDDIISYYRSRYLIN